MPDAAPGLPGAELIYESDGDSVVVEIREVRKRLDQEPEDHLWRIYGDTRFELSPSRWLRHREVWLGEEALEILLQGLDGLLDLPGLQTTRPPPDAGPYVSIHLQRYLGPDGEPAISYLDAIATEALEPVFAELSAIERWLSRRDKILVWVRGPSFPRICEEEVRAEYRLMPDPPWCSGLERFDLESSARRQEVREKLKERLRNLPRGLQEN